MFQFGFSSIRPRPFCTTKAYSLQLTAYSLQLTAYSLQLTAFVKSHFADEERSFTHAPAFYYKWRMESPV
jgi:hypothetical protein